MNWADANQRINLRRLLAVAQCLALGLASLSLGPTTLAQDRLSANRSVMRGPKTKSVSTQESGESAPAEGAPIPNEPRLATPHPQSTEGEGERQPAESVPPASPRVPKAPARDLPASPSRQPEPVEVPGPELSEPGEWMEEPWAESGSACRTWWVSAEYILWWRRGMGLPPLVTTSPVGTPAQDAGVLGAGGIVIYGDQSVGNQARPGGRLSFGSWADPEQTRGWIARAHFLETATASFDASQADFPILARPFLDVSGVPDQNSLLVAFPAGQGNISVRAESDILGGDALWRQLIYVSPRSRVDLLVGYQFANIQDSLSIDSVTDPAGNAFRVSDFFQTRNEFHGGAVGVQFVYDRPGVRLDLLAKVGLGNMHQSVTIDGQTNGNAGGLLAQATNIGFYSRDEFSVVPELGATLSWCLTDSVEFSLGYTFIYYSNVVQSSHAIDPDLAVNLSVPFAGDPRPAFNFQDDDFWVHGLNFGLTFRY